MSHFITLSKTPAAALQRILDNVPKGYTRYTLGTIKVDKIGKLAEKFRHRHSIHASPAQRFLRKKKWQANALLTVYAPSPKEETDTVLVSDTAAWLLLFTSGALASPEKLRDVTEKPHLQWLGYELVRHTFRGKTSWTWQRTQEEAQGLFGMLAEWCQRQQWREVERLLQRAANQPGFHGVREQTWELCHEAKRRGYDGPVPTLYYMRKIKQGERVLV